MMNFDDSEPENVLAIMELEDVHCDEMLADEPSRTPILPWQIIIFFPDNSTKNDPVAGKTDIPIDKLEVCGIETAVEDLEV
jgi:hypothetical protein